MDVPRSVVKRGLLVDALDTFHEVAQIPQQGRTGDQPNAQLRCMVCVGMAASHMKKTKVPASGTNRVCTYEWGSVCDLNVREYYRGMELPRGSRLAVTIAMPHLLAGSMWQEKSLGRLQKLSCLYDLCDRKKEGKHVWINAAPCEFLGQ